jgi:hypothetical protein
MFYGWLTREIYLFINSIKRRGDQKGNIKSKILPFLKRGCLEGGKTNALLFNTRWRLEFYFIFHPFKRVGMWQDKKKNCLAIAKEKKSRK